ncbi:MAG TPA: inorganic phosphate transporter [Thermoanaerobaculia bacterium]|jgi:PiT family inorganic phosphate transporter|nr:inorganic phosphate transporter [Thermoanaerobaculia bacterium]
MILGLPPLVFLVVAFALLFDFTNGWHDSANAVATVISTRVMSPMVAIVMAAILNFVGAFLSTAVAKTIGSDIVDPHQVTQLLTLAALLSAIVWNTFTVWIGMPVSSSHAIVGGVIGAAVAQSGFAILKGKGIAKIVESFLVSPILGFAIGLLVIWVVIVLFARSAPSRVNSFFGRAQMVSAGFMALSHGSNDAQKSMGIVTLALFSAGKLSKIDVPTWVVGACAIAMGIGTAAGGRKVIHTLGMKMIHLKPYQGFAAETSASAVILTASHFGLPVSTTHVISSAIMGVGAQKGVSAVRWGVARNILLAWTFTLPLTAGVAWLLMKLFLLF